MVNLSEDNIFFQTKKHKTERKKELNSTAASSPIFSSNNDRHGPYSERFLHSHRVRHGDPPVAASTQRNDEPLSVDLLSAPHDVSRACPRPVSDGRHVR